MTAATPRNFTGRERELKDLEARYRGGAFELAIVYGRRRVGKTTLIRKFIEDKRAVYFLAVEAGEAFNLESLSRAIQGCVEPGRPLPSFRSFDEAFRYLGNAAREERLVFVIDEYPYLAGAFRGVSSILQAAIDQHLSQTKLFLILCGSSMSFMEEQVMGYKSPLYGRRTTQYRIRPFTFFETRSYLNGMTAEDAAVCYGITGGVADYLSFVRQDRPLRENVVDLFLRPSGRLFEEPSNLLKQELREPKVYNDILSAVAAGASKGNEVADRSGLSPNALSRYMDALISLGIVVQERPVGSRGERRSLYRLKDLMFRFWYRFVGPNLNNISLGLGDRVYSEVVEPELSTFMGQVFERIVMDYVDARQILGTLPLFVTERGRWWGPNPTRKREEEIDLLALGGEGVLLGECKWRAKPTDAHDVMRLIEKGGLFDAASKYYMFFSKAGFTDGARDLAQREGVELVAFADMTAL